MKLIVGLGNPGERYKNNRHNVGYVVIDKLSQMVNSQGLMVKKTNSFMNNSGEAVKKLINHYSLAIDHLYIVHDDLDIPLGSYKIQFGKGPKVHRGVQSIESALGTTDFWRVRVGVDNRHSEIAESISRGPVRGAKHSLTGREYVLQNFSEEEIPIRNKVVDEAAKEILKSTP